MAAVAPALFAPSEPVVVDVETTGCAAHTCARRTHSSTHTHRLSARLRYRWATGACAEGAYLTSAPPFIPLAPRGRSLTRGQSVADWRGHWKKERGAEYRPNTCVLQRVDVDGFYARFCAALGNLPDFELP
jgi:hypothetical protein